MNFSGDRSTAAAYTMFVECIPRGVEGRGGRGEPCIESPGPRASYTLVQQSKGYEQGFSCRVGAKETSKHDHKHVSHNFLIAGTAVVPG